MAVSQPVEYKECLYGVFVKKHARECPTGEQGLRQSTGCIMDTSPRLSPAMGCLSTLLRGRVVLVLLSALLSAACASQQAKVPAPESLQPFPEVRQLTFTGNTHFGSGTLRKL